MLVQNDWRTDSRVIREAEALVRAGHRVEVICRRVCENVEREEHNGVSYLCLPITQHRGYRSYLPALWLWAKLPGLFVVSAVRRKRWRVLPSAASKASFFYIVGALLAVVSAPLAAATLALIVGRKAIVKFLETRRLNHPRPMNRALKLIRPMARAGVRILLRAAAWVQQVSASPFRWLLQGPVYLHDFAAAALPHIRQADARVLHAHDLVTVPAAFLASTSRDRCYLYDAHELETHTNYWSLNRATRFWIAQYERVLIQLAQSSITVCDSIADWLRDHYPIPRPVVVMNAPRLRVATSARGSQARNLRAELDLPRDTPLMIYVGSITIDRGLELCVKALAHMPGVHFALVGPQYEPIVRTLRTIAAAERVTDRLHIRDAVPSEEVVEYVRGADCSVVAIQNVCLSYYFCFPNKLLESVFAGVPVAVANLVELNRFIKKYPVGKVMDERSPASIAEAVTSIIRDGDRFRPSSDQLRQIQAEYGWEAQEARLNGLYRELLARLRNAANPAG